LSRDVFLTRIADREKPATTFSRDAFFWSIADCEKPATTFSRDALFRRASVGAKTALLIFAHRENVKTTKSPVPKEPGFRFPRSLSLQTAP
jgi:hypothetical protein